MIFENEHWKLVISAGYVRKDKTKVKIKCHHCDGRGKECDPFDLSFKTCEWCYGGGYLWDLKPVPEPPKIDEQFLNDLEKWYQAYEPEQND
jgi:hypothetical protein